MIASVLMAPSINDPDEAGRVVGRRTKAPDGLRLEQRTKADSIAWRRCFGGVRIPRGVHRFRSHEEADAWLWKMITRPPRS